MRSCNGMVMLVDNKMCAVRGEVALLVEGGEGGDGELGSVGWVRGQDGGGEEVCKVV
jgi:hypothetical protein